MCDFPCLNTLGEVRWWKAENTDSLPSQMHFTNHLGSKDHKHVGADARYPSTPISKVSEEFSSQNILNKYYRKMDCNGSVVSDD